MTLQTGDSGTEAVEADLRARLATLDLATKVALVTGENSWNLRAVPAIGLRAVSLSDGPAGVRGVAQVDPLPSASFPSPTAMAATWDVAAASGIGDAFAVEAHRQGVDVVLAPVINLQRTPYGGRHFENFSEDPLLVGAMGAALVTAIQSHGIAATPKHFIANETETERTSYTAHLDERTLREVYLAPFEDAVDAGAWAIMSAYNGVDDGVQAAPMSEHGHLVNDILKGELGFDGVVMSDWMAARRTVQTAVGGLDLAMPGPFGPWGDALLAAIEAGTVAESVLDDKVLRVLRLARRVGALDGATPATGRDDVSGIDVAAVVRRLAARSTVVLRRAGDVLPLRKPASVALIGPNAVEAFTQGGGSAHVNPPYLISPADGLRAALGEGVTVTVDAGCTSRLTARLADPGVTDDWTIAHYAAGGHLVASTTQPAGGHVHVTPASAAVLRVSLTGTVRLDTAGSHELGVAALGRHESFLDDVPLHRETSTAHGEDVLTSTSNNPPGGSATLTVDEPRAVRVRVELEIPDLDDFGRWSVVIVRHVAPGPSEDELLDAAVASAVAAEVAVVVVGTNDEVESEGFDRQSLALTGRQDELVRRVAATGTPTIVVVNAGAPVILPWLDEVAAVLWTWFPGQECGNALADVLLGRVEPAGRLPWTLPAREEDIPTRPTAPRDGRLRYDEGVLVGHRAWDAAGRQPARPFGFGLGWTDFEVTGMRAAAQALAADGTADGAADRVPDGSVDLLVTVRNTGERAGTAVAQVYLEPPAGEVVRPLRSLAGFATALIEPGEQADIPVRIRGRAFQTWDVAAHDWTTLPGEYTLHAGLHSRDTGATLTLPR
ncbi:glycoside hydrolase family 3 C-terminal domain-containing protein [Cryobacterium sp. SO2]|uniref:beta-glucosidase family protein n=1 Tax=Cryobacterium sp. SO2 TaxID=1897060 RepID=UPI00223C9645|nr:glycoside hydrolase family 3 C-terminal domain-containing protein [Cryobacterium sp. SO2]WEO76144.1 glycoside hydrolase family 3 C-terminal domain-containing protein [Cryobacterium sp. SO2]